ncbi:hypothetical protein KM043_009018 [Ampulex compressa]|nr:hypothetical protein KM043_009018 [Ampulex compressa]
MDNEAWTTKVDLNDRENEHKLEKLKESFLILKQKMCRSHDLIKQYNDKLKECDRLKTDLDVSNKEVKRLTCNYNSTLAKVIKLELQNTEYKKNIETLSKTVTEQQTKMAGDQQHIQQLTCKVKELEDQHNGQIMQYDLEKSSLQVKIKELEQELKVTRKICDTKIKKMEKKAECAEIDCGKLKKLHADTKMTLDVAVNTIHDECLSFNKVDVEEKCVMTDEFYKVTDDPYPLFCAKCESALIPPPLEKICKMMSNACPEVIEKLSSLPQKLSLSSPPPCLKSATNLTSSSQMSLSSSALNQDNHDDVMITDPAPSQTRVEMRKLAHRDDMPQLITTLSQVPNLMNQSDYYVRTTSSPLPMSTQNVGNQANRYSDLAIASTLSIIDTLQKKVNTLESKMKKQLRRNKQVQDAAPSQHQHISTCCADSFLNTSLHTNMSMELWKRMMDLYDKRDKGNVETTNTNNNKKSNRHRLKKVKLKKCKRLRNVSSSVDAWSVEPVPGKTRHNTVSSKLDKSTAKHYKHSRKSNISLSNEDITDSYNRLSRSSMSNFSKSDAGSLAGSRSRSESESQVEEDYSTVQPTSPEKCDYENMVVDKDSPCSPECPTSHSAEIESSTSTKMEMESLTERVPSATESLKSAGGETDSGILSDSVECNNIGRIETDMETLPNCITVSKFSESENLELSADPTVDPIVDPVVEDSFIEEKPSIEAQLEHDETILDHSDVNEYDEVEKIESVSDIKEDDNKSTEIFTECREPCKIVDTTKLGSQHLLLRTLGSLKRNSSIAGINNRTEASIPKVGGSNACDTSKIVHNDDTVTADSSIEPEDCVPRKKPRIAYTPKISFVRASESLKEHETLNKQKKKKIANYDLKIKALFDSDVEEDPKEMKPRTPSSCDEDILEIETESILDENDDIKHAVTDKVHPIDHTSVNSNHRFMTSRLEANVSKKAKSNSEETEDTDDNIVSAENISSDDEMHSNCTGEDSMFEHTSSDECFYSEDVKKIETKIECENMDMLDVSNKSEDPHPYSIKDENHLEEEKLYSGSKDIKLEDITDNNVKASMVFSSPLSPEMQMPSFNVPYIKEFSHRNLPSMILQRGSKSQNNLLKREYTQAVPEPICISNDVNNIEMKSDQEVLESPASPSPEKSEISLDEPQIQTIPESIPVLHSGNAKKNLLFKNEPMEKAPSLTGSPRSQVQQYIAAKKQNINKGKKEANPQNIRSGLIDRFVKGQLLRLVRSTWNASVHWDIIQKLTTACGTRIIAKCIIDFLYIEESFNRTLRTDYTPPAPVMAKAQQRIAALLVDLELSNPGIIHYVQSGIEYRLFTLNKAPPRGVAEVLSRMYAVLARIKKDREKVRIFCCDALYCLGVNAITVIHAVLACWPEVLPHSSANKEILPRCIAHIILSQEAAGVAPKLYPLKRLVRRFYEYELGTVDLLLAEILTILKERHCNGLDTAILLIAKREGTAWTYKNIVRNSLLPMIIDQSHPCAYRAFCLLGNLLRVFPVDAKDNSVGDIIEQLCDVFNSGEGDEEQQEGIASALLSLSRHDFDKVALPLMKWTPKAPLRPRTSFQLEGFIRTRHPTYWTAFLKKNKSILRS